MVYRVEVHPTLKIATDTLDLCWNVSFRWTVAAVEVSSQMSYCIDIRTEKLCSPGMEEWGNDVRTLPFPRRVAIARRYRAIYLSLTSTVPYSAESTCIDVE